MWVRDGSGHEKPRLGLPGGVIGFRAFRLTWRASTCPRPDGHGGGTGSDNGGHGRAEAHRRCGDEDQFSAVDALHHGGRPRFVQVGLRVSDDAAPRQPPVRIIFQKGALKDHIRRTYANRLSNEVKFST